MKADENEYLYHLDALRGIAALMVVLLHVNWTNHITYNSFIQYGGIFVDFFFVLSGIIICHVYPRISAGKDLWIFFKRRFARLYPLHLITLLVIALGFFIIYYFLGPSIWQSAKKLPEMQNLELKFILNLLFLNAHNLVKGNSYNVPSWSIGAEVTCYIIYGIISLMFFKKKNYFYFILIVLSILFFSIERKSIVTYQDDFGFIRGIYGFFIGCLVYTLRFESRVVPPKSIFLVVLLGAGVILAIALHKYMSGMPSFLFPVFFGILLYLLMTPDPRVTKLLSRPPFQFLGMLSYSIYMLHFLVKWSISLLIVFLFDAKISDPVLKVPVWLGDVFVGIYLTILFGIAWVSYRYYEEPMRRALR